MANPLKTGISNITGKTVYIRHATEADVITVREYLDRRQKEELDFTQAEVVVAAEEDRIIGFGILEKTSDADVGCVMISEERSRSGIGATIAEHLMEYAPMKTIYVVEGEPSYFTKLGFSKATTTPRTRPGAPKSACRRDGSRTSLTTLEKQHA
jgi:N-acetylglutamate synthase-like GNAT family acetyltransferase